MDFDDVLNLEQKFYEEGFKEGQEESTKQSYNEGKEYGFQVGFQKYVFLGQVQAIVDLLSQTETTPQVQSYIAQLKELMSQIKTDNEYGNVVEAEKINTKIRNKLRVLTNLIKKQVTIPQLDEIAGIVSGLEEEKKSQPSIGNLNDDGMW